MNPLLADASDLEAWADRRDAQERLPQLVRRLVLETVDGVSSIRFPAGEAVQHGGWDGRVAAAAGNAFVPNGCSAWEMGVGGSPGAKAQSDYAKRSANPEGVDPADTTFVFVTLRRWPAKDKWVASKAKDGVWREVRAYDADDLETWLELAPGAHVWVSEQVGKSPETAEGLDTYWTAWAEATNPPLSPEVVIAGRADISEELARRVTLAGSIVSLRGDSRQEALAFFAASVQRLPDTERDSLFARTMVISSPTAWRWAVASDRPLVLVPLFEGVELAFASRKQHSVFIPFGKETVSSGESIELPRLRRSAAKDALTRMGFSEERAERLATLARRSLLSLRRQLALSPELLQPTWAQASEARAVIPAMLAGAWDGSQQADRDVLARLAGRSYDEIEATLIGWANQSDPPVRRIGTTWLVVSREDAWSLLSRSLTPQHVQRFEEAFYVVFSGVDPALDLPPEDRWAANLFGKSRPHSAHIREGLAETVALMGARSGQQQIVDSRTGQHHADRIVTRILAEANGDRSGRLWSSLSDVLPLLSEAAPDVFLEQVDRGLRGDDPVLLRLFTDADAANHLFVNSAHTGLLWALENVAWSQDHLGRASLLLARLARIDPGGRLSNRPDESLREIFLLWHPHTPASWRQRLEVLDSIREREPEVAWRVLSSVLPRRHDIAHPTHAPRWREWKPDEQPAVTVGEFETAILEVIDRLLADVGTDERRWQDLLEVLDSLPPEARDRIVDHLLAVNVSALAPEGGSNVRRSLRALVSTHRDFPDEDWAMPLETVNRLVEALARFTPDDLVQRHAWLFAELPDLPDTPQDDWENYSRAVGLAREVAAREVYANGGLSALVHLAIAGAESWRVGWCSGRHVLLQAEEADVLAMLGASDDARRGIAMGYVAGRFEAGVWHWADDVLGAKAAAWTPEQRADFLRALPTSAATWDRAEGLGPETERAYWREVALWGLSEPGDYHRAAAKLIEAGREHAAVELLGRYVRRKEGPPDPELVTEALERASKSTPGSDFNANLFVGAVADLLTYIENSGVITSARLVRLEWTYLPLFRHSGRATKLLHHELARDPAFFVEVVSWVFRAEDEEPYDLTDDERVRAKLGFELLDSWRQIPGRHDDGSIDSAALDVWIAEARERCAGIGRAAIADNRIGHVLRHCPSGTDGAWPHEVVRDVIETVESEELERGIEVEVFNSRGPTWRGLTEGGAQERDLVDRYLSDAEVTRSRWPRTSAMLGRIASTYGDLAGRLDAAAELTEDTWR